MDKTMTPKDIVNNLNKTVKCKDVPGDYTLRGCTIRKRKDNSEFYYQAELLEQKTNRSLLIVDLRSVIIDEQQ